MKNQNSPKRFRWKDRAACIRRISVLISCTYSTVEEAIEQAIFKTDDYADGFVYRYCYNPEAITPDARNHLRHDVYAYQGIPYNVMARGRQRDDSSVQDVQEPGDAATA